MLEGPTPCRSDLPAWWIHQLAGTRFAYRRLAFAQQRRIPACIGFAQPGRHRQSLSSRFKQLFARAPARES